VTWVTNEDSTSKVEYGSTNSYGSSSEDSTLTKIHSITLYDFDSGTTYHYRVISADANSNTATSSDYTFTTNNLGGTEIVTQTVYVAGGGGGGAIDTSPPSIFNVESLITGQNSAKIKWITDESANSIIEYGQTAEYGQMTGSPSEFSTAHEVDLKNLIQGNNYYKIVSLDKSGNKGEQVGKTISISDGGNIVVAEEISQENASGQIMSEDEKIISAVKVGSKSLIERVFDALSKNPFIKNIEEEKITASVSEIANFAISPVVITGESSKIEIGSDWATFEWVTDKNSNSLVALAADKDYNSGKEDPYIKEEGKSNESVTTHKVQINGLEPSTEYHYQLRSEPLFGPLTKSEDLTFNTLSLALNVYDINIEKAGTNAVKILWQTNLPTKTVIEYTNLATGKIEKKEDQNFLATHVLEIEGLAGQASYSFKIKATDEKGNEAYSPTISFSTGEDMSAPEISQVKVDSAISPQGDKVQVIISWKTDELSSSRVAYQKGIAKNESLVKETTEDTALTTNHVVVISSFVPATVYRFNVVSEDLAKNKAVSGDFTILTPQKKQTIIDIISGQFGQIFGWTKNFGF
jgi:chitodextrinase